MGMVQLQPRPGVEGKGHLLNAFCMQGHTCVIPQEFLPTSLVAQYFYSHCTEEDTEAGTGTGKTPMTKFSLCSGTWWWVLKSDPSRTHSTTTARPGLLHFQLRSAGGGCAAPGWRDWEQRLGLGFGTGKRRSPSKAPGSGESP